MIRASTRRRSGFTLLEVLLASIIAIFILSGLYMMFDVTLRQTEEARDIVNVSNMSRNVFQRMGLDLSCTLAPLPPKSGGNSSGSSAAITSGLTGTGTTSTTGTTGTGTSSTGTGTSSSSATGSTSAPTSSSSGSTGTSSDSVDGTAAVAADFPFQGGVMGYDNQLTLFVSRVPPYLADANTFNAIQTGSGPTDVSSDLVRVTYYLASSGQGLCRQERKWVTADGVRNSTDPDRTDEASDIIADDVTAVGFEYFDQSAGSWTSTWDGSVMGSDGVTPLGPPRAVRVTLTMQIASVRPGQPPVDRTVKQVIAIQTAPGSATPTPLDTGTTTDMTTTATGGGM